MNIRVYNGEKFDRSKRRYVGFSVVLISIIFLSLYKKNIVGVVVLFFILGAYFYYSIVANQITKIKIEDNHLIIDKKSFPWSDFGGYLLEIEKKTQEVRNIVFVSKKGHIIYTIHDTQDHLKDFINTLDNHLPMVSEFNQSFLEKAARILKL